MLHSIFAKLEREAMKIAPRYFGMTPMVCLSSRTASILVGFVLVVVPSQRDVSSSATKSFYCFVVAAAQPLCAVFESSFVTTVEEIGRSPSRTSLG